MTQAAFQPPEGFELDDMFSGRRKKRLRPRAKQLDFVDLPIRKRRDMAVSMGWKIRCYPDGAGQFRTHDYIPGDRQWPLTEQNALASQWADIFFMGCDYRRRGVFYNTTIETLAQHMAGKIKREAEDVLNARMGGAPDLVVYTKKEKKGWAMIFEPGKPIDAFGGLTRDGKLAEMIEDVGALMQDREDLHGFVRVDPGYRYGIGLHMVVPEPGLTVEGIARWVRWYRDQGEGEVQIDCQDREGLITQVRAALARKAWVLRRMQADDLGMDPPPEPTDPVGKVMNAASSNAIKM